MTQLINNSGYPLLEVCHWNLKTLTLHKTILSCILRLFRTELPVLSNNILTKLIRFPAKGTISLLKEIFLSGVHLPGNPSRCAITAGDPSVRLCSSAILACKSAWGHQGQKHVKPHPHELNSLQCSHHKSLLSDWESYNQRQNCWDTPPLHSKVGRLLFSKDGSNSGTTLHGGDWGGKPLFSFL